MKTSFPPIANAATTILILGSLPGEKSLELSEYYGHPRNRFWKIIARLTCMDVPLTYADKQSLLLQSKIGVWDVVHKANRIGSLDSAIQDEEPNDLDAFINIHKNLKVIGFNGAKAKILFDKYFERRKDLKYIALPSTSPTNAGITFEDLLKQWEQLMHH